MKKYRLLKDYQTPDVFVPQGSISQFVNGRVTFTPQYSYSYDTVKWEVTQNHIATHPDWFEEVKESLSFHDRMRQESLLDKIARLEAQIKEMKSGKKHPDEKEISVTPVELLERILKLEHCINLDHGFEKDIIRRIEGLERKIEPWNGINPLPSDISKGTGLPYIPKNGELVWIKVFSNWSKGHYVGLDADGKNHIVREVKEGGYNLYKSDMVRPLEDYPNKQTPIPQDGLYENSIERTT